MAKRQPPTPAENVGLTPSSLGETRVELLIGANGKETRWTQHDRNLDRQGYEAACAASTARRLLEPEPDPQPIDRKDVVQSTTPEGPPIDLVAS